MNTTTNAPAERLAELMGRLMNGEGFPPAYSEDFDRITTTVGEFLKGPATEHARLGVLALDLLIEAARAHITTTQVLRDFGSGSFGDRP